MNKFEEDIAAFKRMHATGLTSRTLTIVLGADDKLHADTCEDKVKAYNEVKLKDFLKDPETYLHEKCYSNLLEEFEYVVYYVEVGEEPTFKQFVDEGKSLLETHDYKKDPANFTFEENIRALRLLEVTPEWVQPFSKKTYKMLGRPVDETAAARERNKIVKHLMKKEPTKVYDYLVDFFKEENDFLDRAKKIGKVPEAETLLTELEKLLGSDTRTLIMERPDEKGVPSFSGKRSDHGDESWEEFDYYIIQLFDQMMLKENGNADYWQVPYSLKNCWEKYRSFYPAVFDAVKVPEPLTKTEMLTFSFLVQKNTDSGIAATPAIRRAYESTKALT